MGDIRTVWSDTLLSGDWVIEPPDLASGHDLSTSVLISLFTDRLADEDDSLPDNTGDRRGWWGDTGPQPQRHIGSKLWLLTREKATNDVRLRAEDYAREALAWMLTDGVADQIDVAAAWVEFQRLDLSIDIWRQARLLMSGKWGLYWREELLTAIEGSS